MRASRSRTSSVALRNFTKALPMQVVFRVFIRVQQDVHLLPECLDIINTYVRAVGLAPTSDQQVHHNRRLLPAGEVDLVNDCPAEMLPKPFLRFRREPQVSIRPGTALEGALQSCV